MDKPSAPFLGELKRQSDKFTNRYSVGTCQTIQYLGDNIHMQYKYEYITFQAFSNWNKKAGLFEHTERPPTWRCTYVALNDKDEDGTSTGVSAASIMTVPVGSVCSAASKLCGVGAIFVVDSFVVTVVVLDVVGPLDWLGREKQWCSLQLVRHNAKRPRGRGRVIERRFASTRYCRLFHLPLCAPVKSLGCYEWYLHLFNQSINELIRYTQKRTRPPTDPTNGL